VRLMAVSGRTSRVAHGCAALTAAVGLMGIAGWAIGFEPFKRVLHSFAAMKFNTALCFVVAGAALGCRKRLRFRLGLAAAVALCGALSLVENLAGLDLGIDQLFVREIVASPEAAFSPGRMAPSTALCFLLFGIALIGAGGELPRPGLGLSGSAGVSKALAHTAEMLALVASVIGGFSLIAYPTGAVYLRQLPGFVSMALNTAVAFVILGVGILSAADGTVAHSLRLRGTGRLVWIGFGVLTCALVAVGVAYAVNIQTLAQDIDAQANVARPRREATHELENDILGYGLAVRLALAGDTRARSAAQDEATDLERHLAEYRRLATTDRQRELAASVAVHWHDVRTMGAALLQANSPPSHEELTSFAGLSTRLVRVVEEQMRPEAVEAFEARRAVTLRDLSQAGNVPLLLLVVSVLLAVVASGAVARAVSRHEHAVRASEEKFAKAFHGSTSAMAITRLFDGRFIDVNDRYLEVTRWGRSEVIGKTSPQLDIWRHPDERDRFVRALEQHGVVRNEEFTFAKKGGEEWTGLVFSQLGEIGGEKVVISSIVDITERKRAEEALAAANLELSESDRRKNEFLAVLSHELRNPLAPIKNSIYILDRAAADGEQAKRAKEVIGRQVEHLSRLVDDLLDVTRITRNKVRLQLHRLDLNALVHRTAEDYRSLFERRDVRLEVALTAGRVPVDGDEARLAQVVGNLLQNAAKFARRSGAARVNVGLDAETKRAVLTVSDSGVGIEAEILAKLFQPFMQADSSLDRSKGGLGLGLALVKGLVELHGGGVSAHSEGAGRGAQFVVWLPLADQSAEESLPHATTKPGGSRRGVLIIEDNADAADSLREALEFGAHEVAIARDGAEGLAKAREFRPEVVLCDIGLPGTDGYQVARTFKADQTLRGTFLVALSGYALPEDLRRAEEAGFDHHLAKPPSLESIERLLAHGVPSGCA
jgi:PAS domain S-box-containing protein